MEFLGIEIDTNAMELRISDDRLQEIICDLQLWKYRVSCNKRELLYINNRQVNVRKSSCTCRQNFRSQDD